MFWPTKQHLNLRLGESTRLINHTTYFVSHCIICFISFQSKARQLPVFHLYESLILANILERCSSRISATVKMSWKRRKIVVDNTSYIIRFSYIWIKYTHNTEWHGYLIQNIDMLFISYMPWRIFIKSLHSSKWIACIGHLRIYVPRITTVSNFRGSVVMRIPYGF